MSLSRARDSGSPTVALFGIGFRALPLKTNTNSHVRSGQKEQENGYYGMNNIVNGVRLTLRKYFGYTGIVSIICVPIPRRHF